VWAAVVGPDAGLEQQADEFVDNFAPGALDDWREIKAAAERAAVEQLRDTANAGRAIRSEPEVSELPEKPSRPAAAGLARRVVVSRTISFSGRWGHRALVATRG
jgi:hypothetical protein